MRNWYIIADARSPKRERERKRRKREKSHITFSRIIGRKFFSRFNVHWQRTRSRARRESRNIHEENISGGFLMVSSGGSSAPVWRRVSQPRSHLLEPNEWIISQAEEVNRPITCVCGCHRFVFYYLVLLPSWDPRSGE